MWLFSRRGSNYSTRGGVAAESTGTGNNETKLETSATRIANACASLGIFSLSCRECRLKIRVAPGLEIWNRVPDREGGG